MKVITKYENKLTNHQITETCDIDITSCSQLDLLIKYAKLICPYINIDDILNYYSKTLSPLKETLNINLYHMKYLRLENIIMEEIDFINDMHKSEVIKFSISLEDDDIFVFEIPYENDT